MAFLNKINRIIDMKLTDLGRDLLAKNKLNFVYYAFSDDTIDYSQQIHNSASLSSSQISSTIEELIGQTYGMEVVNGHFIGKNMFNEDTTNIKNLLYTNKTDASVLLSGTLDNYENEYELKFVQTEVKQISEKVGIVNTEKFLYFERDNKNNVLIFKLDDENVDGYFIRVFESGTDGFKDIKLSYGKKGVPTYSKYMEVDSGEEISLNKIIEIE